MKFQALVALSFTFVSQLAFGWGDLGHQTVAEIAERELAKTSPQTLQAIYKILGMGPLAAAATWPDQVRFDPTFKPFEGLHFVEIPPGKTFAELPRKQINLDQVQSLLSKMAKASPEELKKAAEDPIIDKFDAHTVLTMGPAMLANPDATIGDKMVALRYILHVVGDIHAPLHVGNGHDQGGNFCQVDLVDPFTGVVSWTNLHTLWDENIIWYLKDSIREQKAKEAEDKAPATGLGTPPPKRYFEYQDFANIIEKERARVGDLTVHEDLIKTFEGWYADSVKVRDQWVYPDVEAGMDPGTDKKYRPYCKYDHDGEVRPATMKPRLDRRYLETRLPIVEAQILKGGLRLAALLKRIFDDPKVNGTEEVLPKLIMKTFVRQ